MQTLSHSHFVSDETDLEALWRHSSPYWVDEYVAGLLAAAFHLHIFKSPPRATLENYIAGTSLLDIAVPS